MTAIRPKHSNVLLLIVTKNSKIKSTGIPTICEILIKLFLNYRYRHIQTVHIKKHRCDWPGCEHIAFNKAKLDIHKTIHTGKTPFVCDWPECGFMARTKDNLKHHKYRHTGERPYPCKWPDCDKRQENLCIDFNYKFYLRFRSESAFSTHMRLHANDRCYSCEWPGCEFATHDRSHLRTHRLRHQKDLMQKSDRKPNQRLKVVIKTNNNLIKKSINKRNVRKPKRYESDSESNESSDDYFESD